MKRMICIFAALLLAASLLAGCSTPNATPVSVQSVGMLMGYGALGNDNRYAGIVEAGRTVAVQKAEDMEIGTVYVAVGDTVGEGQLLFSYDTDAAQLELDKAKLEKEQLENTVATKTAAIEQLEKEKKTVAADKQIDYTLEIQELELDISEANINIEAKQKQIDRLQNSIDNSEVRAEIEGRVQSISDTSAEDYDPTKPFMQLIETANYRVKGTVTEQYAASLVPGTRMLIRSRMDETLVWYGTVESVDLENPVQSGNNNYYDYGTGGDEMSTASKYPFYVALEDDTGLLLGQHVYIEADTGEQTQGLYLYAAYLCDADGSSYVWACKGDKLEKRSVILGHYDEMNDSWEIVSGLTVDDYIAFPDETCVAGAPVVRYDENSFDMPAEDSGAWEDEGTWEDEGAWEEGVG